MRKWSLLRSLSSTSISWQGRELSREGGGSSKRVSWLFEKLRFKTEVKTKAVKVERKTLFRQIFAKKSFVLFSAINFNWNPLFKNVLGRYKIYKHVSKKVMLESHLHFSFHGGLQIRGWGVLPRCQTQSIWGWFGGWGGAELEINESAETWITPLI